MNIKNEKGITLISLTVTVIILLIITSVIIYNSTNYITMKKLNNLYRDIESINSKIDEYYLKYNELPTLCKYLEKEEIQELLIENAEAKNTILNGSLNESDGDDEYYVIDLEKLSSITLIYGYDSDYQKIKENKKITINGVEDEVYIINAVTHQVYFPHGIAVDDYMYYYLE